MAPERVRLHRRPETSEGAHPWGALEEAKSAMTSASRLGELSRGDAAVRGVVAQHPGLGADEVGTLARDLSAGVRARVASRRGGLGPPRFMASDPSDKVRLALASNPTQPWALEQLWRDPSEPVRKAVASHPSVSLVDVALAADPSPRVRLALSRNPAATAPMVARLLTDVSPAVRYAAAHHDSAPEGPLTMLRAVTRTAYLASCERHHVRGFDFAEGELAWLAGSGELGRSIAAMSEQTDAGTLSRLARDESPMVRAGAAGNRALSAIDREALSADRWGVVRQAVAHATGDEALLERLSTDPSDEVRLSVAMNQASPASAVARLFADASYKVREAAFRHARLPEGLLREGLGKMPARLARGRLDEQGWRQAIERGEAHDAAWYGPASLLPLLVSHPSDAVRRAVALKGDEALLERLVGDSDERTRANVAENTSASRAALERLSGDESLVVRYGVARNARTADATIERLARDPSPQVRRGVAERATVPPSLWAALAADEAVEVRAAVARHAAAPGAVRGALLGDEHEHVRACAAMHATAAELGALASDGSERVREAVARHVATGAADLCRLVHDPEARVRLAAVRNGSLPPGELAAAASDPSDEVRAAAVELAARRARAT